MCKPRQPYQIICGIDEVGRGPLAGPVTAAAVILPPTFHTAPLRDSKALSPAARERLYATLQAEATAIGVGWVSAEEIDELNIHHATLRAMERAFWRMCRHGGIDPRDITKTVVDGKFTPPLPTPSRAIVGGDSTEAPIMAASIIAKVERDRFMVAYAHDHPLWGFERHKGYPTPAHKAAIVDHGVCDIHRRSFRGVKEHLRTSPR